jgi:hypothetical protein
VINVNEPDQ